MLPPDDAHDRRADEDRFEDDRLEDGLPIVGAVGGLVHNGQPIRDFNRGEPIPDLTRIPQEQWRAALAPVSRHTRLLAAAATPTLDGARVASELVGELMLGDAESRARNAPPPSAPAGAALARGPARQVGFRLSADDYE